MAVTMKDVAQVAGVSVSAVSRCFTPDAPIAELTRQRIEGVAKRLGYRPNKLASGLASGRTRLVGVVVDDLTNPLFTRALESLTPSLQELGLCPILINLKALKSPDVAMQMLQDYAVDLVVLLSSTLPVPVLRAFGDINIPVVHAFGRATDTPEISQVGIKDGAVGRIAARTLHDRGYQRLGFIGGKLNSTPWRDRFAGFRNMGGKLHHDVVSVETNFNTYAAGETAMQSLLDNDFCDGIFCASDTLALGALAALQKAGKKIPDEVGVIGLGDLEMAEWQGIELTTLRIPVEKIISTVVSMAQDLLKDPGTPPVSEVFGTNLISRGTLRDPN